MKLLLLGMNHKTAPLDIRERLSFDCGEGFCPLQSMKALPAVREALYLSTCNRVEILARVDPGAEAIAQKALTDLILGHGNLAPEELGRCLYVLKDEAAVRHLFRVASSLDSLIVGEPQILGQVKDAYRLATEASLTGILLNRIAHAAFRTAKRVRTETEIARHAVSVSHAAVSLAKKIFGRLHDKTVLLVGAGEMSELAARQLAAEGVGRTLIANRTHERAVSLAEAFQGKAVPFDELPEVLAEADIVISSTGTPHWILSREMVAAALHRRRNRFLFIIDIAVPRDVDPAAGTLDNVYLYNMDDLQAIADENRHLRQAATTQGEAIVAEELARTMDWFFSLDAVPTIVSLREKLDSLAAAEIQRASGWMQGLPEADRRAVEALVRALINKILHDPATSLREETAEPGGKAYVAALRRLFRLEEPAARDDASGKETP